MIDVATVATVGMAFLIVTASPGPGNLASASVSMIHGRRIGLRFAAGLASGLLFWGIVAMMGIGAVLQTSARALFVLKLLGGGYLIWLALQSARRSMNRALRPSINAASGRWYLRGLFLNLSNPKAVLAWMAAFSVGLDTSGSFSTLIAAMAFCVTITVLNAAFWAMVFSTSEMISLYERSRRWVDGIVAGLFAVAGLGMLKSALSR